MRRLFKGHFLLVIAALTCVTLPAVSAFESSKTDLIAQKNPLIKQKSIWERPKRGPGRGDEICLISPNDKDYQTWSNKPLFAWKGTVERIQVLDPINPVWSHNLTPEEKSQQRIFYDDQKATNQLEPGKTYMLRLYPNAQAAKFDRISFQVLSEEEQLKIQADLDRLKQENANLSEKELAEKRREYFEKKALLLDAIREFFSYASADEIERLRNTHCPQSPSQTTP